CARGRVAADNGRTAAGWYFDIW
nr:immunoglobulin heavy chain junction region [Macaca mulatta]